LFILSFVILLAACSAGGEVQPPDIHYGEDVCGAWHVDQRRELHGLIDQDGAAPSSTTSAIWWPTTLNLPMQK
jgi:hypothetical protein